MDVTIVSPWAMQHDHILRRMARALTEAHGWPVADRPIPGTVNYFFPYQATARVDGPTAALFTHDAGAPQWQRAAQRVDLRLTISPLYLARLRRYGPTVRVVPGIDLGHYRLAANSHRRDIGTSGIVYGDGRKGEGLIARLHADGYSLRNAGRGWAGPTLWLGWRDLPGWYRSLRVYVCTSRIDGGPAGPLEALACGTPVVVPRGVGVMDELPAMPGIHHYTVGDYADLCRAIGDAEAATSDPAQLRHVAERYSYGAWALSHGAAVRHLARICQAVAA